MIVDIYCHEYMPDSARCQLCWMSLGGANTDDFEMLYTHHQIIGLVHEEGAVLEVFERESLTR